MARERLEDADFDGGIPEAAHWDLVDRHSSETVEDSCNDDLECFCERGASKTASHPEKFGQRRSDPPSEVGIVLSKTFGKSCSFSVRDVSCVRTCARETGLRCTGVFRIRVSLVFLLLLLLLLSPRCPAGFPTLSRSFFSFFIFYFSIFLHSFRCRALSSRSLGFGRHSPNLLVSHLVGLTGVEITNKGDAHTFAVWYTSVGPRATGEPCCDTRH